MTTTTYSPNEAIGAILLLLFGLSALAPVLILLRYNLTTIRLWNQVSRIAREEGTEWSSWADPRQRARFFFMPDEFMDPSDSPRLSNAKMALVRHRKQVWRSTIIAGSSILLGLALIVIICQITRFVGSFGIK